MSSHEDKVDLKRGGRTKGMFDLHESPGFNSRQLLGHWATGLTVN